MDRFTCVFFYTAGPVNCQDHYCLPPLERLDLNEVLLLIDQKKYFVLHAPRQTGKTSCLLVLMDYLNSTGRYQCLYFNVEVGQAAREDVKQGMTAVLSEMASNALDYLKDDSLETQWAPVLEKNGEFNALGKVLSLWAKESPLPLVLLIDEIDSLVGDTLISVLRQLRSGYPKRPLMFPQSIMLCGVRDVRDYRIHSSREKAIITGGSAFNIKAESLRLGDFTKEDIEMLYRQHTEEAGQPFEKDALESVWELTEGQPWLVNALGYEVCFKIEEGRDRGKPITVEMIHEAAENIILRRDTHIDQLADKLKEERVRQVIEPLLAGKSFEEEFEQDNVRYVVDLGLVKQQRNGELRISNRIYQEVIPRDLAWNAQTGMAVRVQWYVDPDGRLNMSRLLSSFQEFFREHSEHWIERFQYKEAGPQILLQAFLQRIVNSGGRMEREYGLGRMRTDLLVIWPLGSSKLQKVVLELKVLHKSLERTMTEGLHQTVAYMERSAADEGHLVIFDRDLPRSWDEKISRRVEACKDRTITVWGM
jgi:hypothetical protein